MKTGGDSDRLRIAVIIRRFISTGGAEKYCVELSKRLARDHEVHVYAQEYTQSAAPDAHFHPIGQWRAKPRFVNQWLFARDTGRAIGEEFDIVHSHDMLGHADVYTLHVPCFRSRYGEVRGLRRLLLWMGTLTSPRELSYLLMERRQFSTRRHAKVFIAVSEYMRRNILAAYPETAGRIHLAPPGIDAGAIPAIEAAQKQALRKTLDISPGRFVLLFVAHDFRKKGLDALLQAMHELDDDTLLLVAGGGKQKAYRTRIQAMGLAQRVRFLGPRDSLTPLYHAADALVHPTRVDTYGMTVLEAMAHGLPVIVSDRNHCGIAAQLSADSALQLTDPNAAGEIAGHIATLRENAELRARLARQGRGFALGATWEQTTAATLGAYRELLSRRSSSARPAP